MGVKLVVKGEVKYGQLHKFLSAVEQYKQYRKRKGWVAPEVLQALAD